MEIHFLVQLEDLNMSNKMKKNILYFLPCMLIFMCCNSKVIRMNEFDFNERNRNSEKNIIAGSLKIEIVDSLSFFRITNKKGYFKGVIVDAKCHRPICNVVILRDIQSAFTPMTFTDESGFFELSFKLAPSNRFAFYIAGCDTLFVNLDKHFVK